MSYLREPSFAAPAPPIFSAAVPSPRHTPTFSRIRSFRSLRRLEGVSLETVPVLCDLFLAGADAARLSCFAPGGAANAEEVVAAAEILAVALAGEASLQSCRDIVLSFDAPVWLAVLEASFDGVLSQIKANSGLFRMRRVSAEALRSELESALSVAAWRALRAALALYSVVGAAQGGSVASELLARRVGKAAGADEKLGAALFQLQDQIFGGGPRLLQVSPRESTTAAPAEAAVESTMKMSGPPARKMISDPMSANIRAELEGRLQRRREGRSEGRGVGMATQMIRSLASRRSSTDSTAERHASIRRSTKYASRLNRRSVSVSGESDYQALKAARVYSIATRREINPPRMPPGPPPPRQAVPPPIPRSVAPPPPIPRSAALPPPPPPQTKINQIPQQRSPPPIPTRAQGSASSPPIMKKRAPVVPTRAKGNSSAARLIADEKLRSYRSEIDHLLNNATNGVVGGQRTARAPPPVPRRR